MIIFTICTENYNDALEMFLPSWVRFDAVERVYVYTNYTPTYKHEKVFYLNILRIKNDWLQVVGQKAFALKDVMKRTTHEHLAYIDIDCYMHYDISEVFREDFDIAATRMNKGTSANSGVFFCRKSERIERFADQWMSLQKSKWLDGIGTVKYAQSYQQLSYSEILHRELKNKTYLDVLPIGIRYNYENNVPQTWIENIKFYKPKILHLKGRMFRDRLHMEKMHQQLETL